MASHGVRNFQFQNEGRDCSVCFFNVNDMKIKRRRITACKKNNLSCVKGMIDNSVPWVTVWLSLVMPNIYS